MSREVRTYGTAEERAAVHCINATKGVRAHHQTSDRKLPKKSMTSTLTDRHTDLYRQSRAHSPVPSE